MILLFMRPKQPKGFEKIKDIVRGTIIADLDNFYDAYLHFKNTPNVKIVDIKEKLNIL